MSAGRHSLTSKEAWLYQQRCENFRYRKILVLRQLRFSCITSSCTVISLWLTSWLGMKVLSHRCQTAINFVVWEETQMKKFSGYCLMYTRRFLFCVVTQCMLIVVYRRFKQPIGPIFKAQAVLDFLNLEHRSRYVVNKYQHTLPSNPEERRAERKKFKCKQKFRNYGNKYTTRCNRIQFI